MDFFLLAIGNLINHLEVIIVSGIKFFLASPVSYLNGFNYLQTVLFTTIGGIAGLFFFFFFSGWLIRRYRILLIFLERRYKQSFTLNKLKQIRKNSVNVEKSKLLNFVMNKMGFFGFILLTPVVLSIPIGAFIAKRYYSNKRYILVYLSLSVVFWAVLLSALFSIPF